MVAQSPTASEIMPSPVVSVVAAAFVAAIFSALLIVLTMPLLRRYALARPNARSSHVTPTPQGGGIAVVSAMLSLLLLIPEMGLVPLDQGEIVVLRWVMTAALMLAVLGAVDDVRPLPVVPRFVLQILAVGIAVWAMPTGVRLFDASIPLWLERALAVFAGLWFVNLTNFMDGLDWITFADIAPPAAAISLLALLGYVPASAGLVATILCGAMLGFAPFNKPVARLFLGDVGSLAIGLLLAWCLYRLAAQGHLAAALILPLYPVADATWTLLRRLRAGEKIWQAHRSHFYQRATTNGFSVMQVSATVFALNVVLAGLAFASVVMGEAWLSLVAAAGAVASVLVWFSRGYAR